MSKALKEKSSYNVIRIFNPSAKTLENTIKQIIITKVNNKGE